MGFKGIRFLTSNLYTRERSGDRPIDCLSLISAWVVKSSAQDVGHGNSRGKYEQENGRDAGALVSQIYYRRFEFQSVVDIYVALVLSQAYCPKAREGKIAAVSEESEANAKFRG